MFEPAEISRLRQEVARYAKAFDADLVAAGDAVVVLDEAARQEDRRHPRVAGRGPGG